MYKLKYPSVKIYNTMQNVGKAKYVISFHDGKKAHLDGSRFFDIKICKNKNEFEKFEKELKNEGYVYGQSTFVTPPQTTPLSSISDKKENEAEAPSGESHKEADLISKPKEKIDEIFDIQIDETMDVEKERAELDQRVNQSDDYTIN